MMEFAITVIARTSALFLCAAILALLLRRASAATRHTVWALTMAAVLALPFATMILPRLDIPILDGSPEMPAAVSALISPPALTVPQQAPVPEAFPHTESSNVSKPTVAFRWPWRRALFAVWAVGAALVFIRFILGLIYYGRLAAFGISTSEEAQSVAEELKGRLSIPQDIDIVRIDEEIPPMTCGIFRNVILLPGCSETWSAERKAIVLAHELAHVRRRDGWFQFLDRITCSIYWFNPLVWLASTRLRLERERACDDAVLLMGVNPNDYADHLLDIAKAINVNRRQAYAAVSMAQKSQLETRLRSIVEESCSRKELSRRMKAALVAAILLSIGPLAALHVTALPSPGRIEPFGYITPLVAPLMRAESVIGTGARSAPAEKASPFAAEFVAILPGTFVMGCGRGEGCFDADVPAHSVRITRPFEIGKYEVTQAQWESVMESNPSDFRGPDLPVEQVSWNDVQRFLAALNSLNDGFQYRLPTEAEWEYAARANNHVNWLSGPRIPAINGFDALADVAWTGRNSDGHTHPVGQKQPNAWGIYDMFGNVSEMMSDWYQEGYDTDSAVDPHGPPSGFGHVIRGSSWDLPFSPRLRFDAGIDAKYDFIGFRVVRQRRPPGRAL